MSPSAIAAPAGRLRSGGRAKSGARPRKSETPGSDARGIWLRRGLYGALILALIFASDALYRWSLTSPYFRIKHVEVSGTSHLSQSVIRARLGLGKNDNLLALDLETLRRKVESHPWVRSISLSRNLPGTLRVEVAERTPWAVYAPAARGIKYLIDAEGVILADARAGSGKFPVLRGLDSSRKPPTAFEAGQMLGGAALEAGLGAIHAYLAMQPDFRRGGVRLAAVDMGRLETERTIQMDMLGPNGQSTLVRLSPRDMKGGFRRFAALIHQWRKTSWPGEVNLAMGSRVIVR